MSTPITGAKASRSLSPFSFDMLVETISKSYCFSSSITLSGDVAPLVSANRAVEARVPPGQEIMGRGRSVEVSARSSSPGRRRLPPPPALRASVTRRALPSARLLSHAAPPTIFILDSPTGSESDSLFVSYRLTRKGVLVLILVGLCI
jgi:hypothetical protein